MSHAGRDLELLVESIEKALAGAEGVRVVSPYLTRDRHTGQRREIDVAVFSKVGSAELLVIFECRERNRTADVRWIEQIATLRDAVSASKAVAVSATGFTRPALSKAAAYLIETRRLRKLVEGDFKDLGLMISEYSCEIGDIILRLADSGEERPFSSFEDSEDAWTRCRRIAKGDPMPALIAGSSKVALPIQGVLQHFASQDQAGALDKLAAGDKYVAQFMPHESPEGEFMRIQVQMSEFSGLTLKCNPRRGNSWRTQTRAMFTRAARGERQKSSPIRWNFLQERQD